MVIYDSRPSAFTQLTSTSDWESFQSASGCLSGIDMAAGSAMAPSLDVGGRNAVLADGVAVIRGQLWRCDAPVSVPIPAASAQNRIDRLVLRLTRGATTSATVVVATVIAGTPSGSPVKPPLVQTTTGIYDIPISSWSSTSAGAITSLIDERQIAVDTWHDMRPLLNTFIGTIAGEFPPQYILDPNTGLVQVMGSILLPASGGYNGLNIVILPVPYRPVDIASWAVVQLSGSMSTNTNSSPRCYIDSTGGLQVNGISSSLNGAGVMINGAYPLQGYKGVITT